MRSPLPTLLRLTCLAGLCAALAARGQTPELRAEETFSYTAGTIVGKNGGSGWAGAWTMPYGSGAALQVGSGQSLVFGSATGSVPINSAGRVLDRAFSAATTAYAFISFRAQIGTQWGGGTPTLRLFDGGTQTGALGSNGGGNLNANYSILDGTLASGGASANSGVALGSDVHVLYRIDYLAGTSSLWVGGAAFNLGAPPTTGAQATVAFAPAFDRFHLLVRQLTYLDDLRVHEVTLAAVPEPASAGALAGLGALAWAVAGRRRRGGA